MVFKFLAESERPDVVLLPELAVPRGFKPVLAKLAEDLGAVVIGGLDYNVEDSLILVKNEGVVIVPRMWGETKTARRTTTRVFGKLPRSEGKGKLKKGGYLFDQSPEVWVFDAGEFGRFGVTICFDLRDLQRLAMYRQHIHHLFVLAYNPDLDSFAHAAQATARMLFVNIVIINTGHYGGSVAIAPYYAPHRRVIFQHEGMRLYSSQIFEISLSSIAEAQNGKKPKGPNGAKIWKSLPPGFPKPAPVQKKVR